MGSLQVLARVAVRLNREAGSPAIPSLYLFTDPLRLPDPFAAAARLPRGAAVVYRHFGAADRFAVARGLARLARRRGLVLLVAADPDLAARVGADGVHWPERLLPSRRGNERIVTAAAHSAAAAARAFAAGMDCCVLGPLLPTASSSGRRPLGLFRASQTARAAPGRVIGLGGINVSSAPLLVGRGFAGIAAVEGLAGPAA